MAVDSFEPNEFCRQIRLVLRSTRLHIVTVLDYIPISTLVSRNMLSALYSRAKPKAEGQNEIKKDIESK